MCVCVCVGARGWGGGGWGVVANREAGSFLHGHRNVTPGRVLCEGGGLQTPPLPSSSSSSPLTHTGGTGCLPENVITTV